MLWLEIVGSAIVAGVLAGVVTALTLYRTLVSRLAAHTARETATAELAQRRQIHDSGRTQAIRADAGPNATIKKLLITRPGVLARNRLTQRNTRG